MKIVMSFTLLLTKLRAIFLKAGNPADGAGRFYLRVKWKILLKSKMVV